MKFVIGLLWLTLTNALHLTTPLFKPRISNIQMNYKPQELIQSLGRGQIGNEWTYEDFLANLKGHLIDSATVTDNGRVFFIDKESGDFRFRNYLHAEYVNTIRGNCRLK